MTFQGRGIQSAVVESTVLLGARAGSWGSAVGPDAGRWVGSGERVCDFMMFSSCSLRPGTGRSPLTVWQTFTRHQIRVRSWTSVHPTLGLGTHETNQSRRDHREQDSLPDSPENTGKSFPRWSPWSCRAAAGNCTSDGLIKNSDVVHWQMFSFCDKDGKTGILSLFALSLLLCTATNKFGGSPVRGRDYESLLHRWKCGRGLPGIVAPERIFQGPDVTFTPTGHTAPSVEAVTVPPHCAVLRGEMPAASPQRGTSLAQMLPVRRGCRVLRRDVAAVSPHCGTPLAQVLPVRRNGPVLRREIVAMSRD